MGKSFDEAYAAYRETLAKLDETDDIAGKNRLFRRLAELLAEMEYTVKSNSTTSAADQTSDEQSELTNWI